VERDLARVFEAVQRAERDVGRLVLGQHQFFVAAADAGGALHHDPMLGAVMVHLQRQLAARLDQDVLDLHPVAGVQRLVRTPRAMDARQRLCLAAVFGDEARDQMAHVLGAAARRQHHRVLGRDDDQIVDSERGDQPGLGADVVVAGILGDDVAGERVAGGILVRQLPQRVPRAEVAPPHRHRHHRGAGGVLHHRIVDRVGRAIGERRLVEPAEILVAARALERLPARGEHVGPQPRELAHVLRRRKQEDAAVPKEIAGRDIALGGGSVGLFDKPRDLEHTPIQPGGGAGERLAALDIAVAGLGPLRMDAESHETSRPRGDGGALDRGLECGHILDRVVGRHHQHQRLRIGLDEKQRGDRRGRRGVAADRLQQQCLRRRLDTAQLLGDDKAVLLVGDHQRVGKAGRARHPQRRLLQQAVLADQGQ
jgi:hypothetical protein